MTTQPQPEALRLAEAMKQRVIPRWVHATGETPRQSGFAADAECQAAADMLLRLHAECEALRMERDALRAAANNGGWMGYFDDEVGKLRAECEALRADAERWRKWLPWIGGLNRKPFGLAMEIKQIDAARAAKEQSNG